MMMLHTPHDHACSLAVPMFKRVAKSWSTPGNITFALIEVEHAPKLAKSLGAGGAEPSLPVYALSLQGVAAPVRYRGGWSDASIDAWLKRQAALNPVEVHTVDDLRALAERHEHALVVVGFLGEEQQRERRVVEAAARGAQVQAAVALGDNQLASDLDLQAPCIVVARGAEYGPWPLLRGGGTLPQSTVETFLHRRAMPLLIPIGDSTKSFSMQVRTHPIQMHVLLIHRSGARGPDEASDAALGAMRSAAITFDGRALFLAYDFFDNDPDQFTSQRVYENQLPAVLVLHGRGGFSERKWRLPGGGELRIEGSDIENLVSHALDSIGDELVDDGSFGESQTPPSDFARMHLVPVAPHGAVDEGDRVEEDDGDEAEDGDYF
jgi:hypothetical protein